MWRNLALASAAGLLIVSGIVHGLWTDRWQRSPEIAEFVARLDHIPRDVGDWHGEDQELSADELRAARIDGYCYRRYQNARNRHVVTLLVVCGQAGPIAVHTPDICFTGAGFQAVTSPIPLTLAYGAGDDEATLNTMRLSKPDAAFPTEVRVFWTWSAGGPWAAPANPRTAFAGRRALYKMYVHRDKSGDDASRNPGLVPNF